MRPERERAGNREDYTVKEAHAPTTPPNGSTRYIFAPKAVRCSKNGKASMMKASNLSRPAHTVQKHVQKTSM
jgi:hypothetical protein